MPDPKNFYLDYRPKSYWVFRDRLQHVMATVKGTFRRQIAKLALDGSPLGDIDPYCMEQSLPEDERAWRMSLHPEFGGGEFLPDLQPWEVEIARVSYNSTFSDVASVRAARIGGRICYAVVDDFSESGEVYSAFIPTSSDNPLSMRELIQLMDTASIQPDDDPEGWWTGMVQGPIRRHYDNHCFDSKWWPKEPDGFAFAYSAFYPDLSIWYEEVDCELWEEYAEKVPADVSKAGESL